MSQACDCIFKNKNPKIFNFLAKNFHRISVGGCNTNTLEYQKLFLKPDCIEFLEYILDAERIKILTLQNNTHLLFNIKSMLNWEIISQNPVIFELDKEAMFNNFEPLKKEILNYPQIRVIKLLQNIINVQQIKDDKNKSLDDNLSDDNTSTEESYSID